MNKFTYLWAPGDSLTALKATRKDISAELSHCPYYKTTSRKVHFGHQSYGHRHRSSAVESEAKHQYIRNPLSGWAVAAVRVCSTGQ